jgi:hypothetical protein
MDDDTFSKYAARALWLTEFEAKQSEMATLKAIATILGSRKR